MERQLWIGMEPLDPAKFQPVQNRPRLGWMKPEKGGLWTSTWLPEQQASDWVIQSRENDYSNPDSKTHWYLLESDPAARLITIATYADLKHWIHTYRSAYSFQVPGFEAQHYFDFEKVANEWDGIHLTYDGQWATRLSHPLDLYGWDCESTLWFRWCFTAIEQISPCIEVIQRAEVESQ